MRYLTTAALVATLTGWAGVFSANVRADPAFRRDFNGPDTAWELMESAAGARIMSQECAPVGARDSFGAERIVAAASAGSSVRLISPIDHVAVLSELQLRIWVKADRPAVQLAARVALPRTLDPKTNSAVTIVVRGKAYDRPGQWQNLSLHHIPKLLAAEVRVLRSTPGVKIDPKEAYIDAVTLIIPGDPNGVEVFTDELEVDGILLKQDDDIQLASFPSIAIADSSRDASLPSPVRLQGGLLLVDDTPFLPRVIEWQGEPLAFLAERGFNVVRLSDLPSDEQIADAQRHSLWFLCSPPLPEALAQKGVGRAGDRVLAWILEDDAVRIDPGYALRWAELLRERDAVAGRLVIIDPKANWHAASKAADVLVASHSRLPLLSGSDYDQWLQHASRQARPGTPFWANYATEFGPVVQRQCEAINQKETSLIGIDGPHLERLLQIACTQGTRGFMFRSYSRLNENDPVTRRRAVELELNNRRLQLIEPWLAGGKVIGRLASDDGAWTGVVLHVDRARLLIPVSAAESENREADSPPIPSTEKSDKETVFLIPGIPDSTQAFSFSPASMRTLPAQRVAGGTRLKLPSPRDAMILITEDPQVITSIRQRVTRDGARIVRLERDLAALRAAQITDNARRLMPLGHRNDAVVGRAASALGPLSQIDSLISGGRVEDAYGLAHSANKTIEEAADEQRRAIHVAEGFDSHPLALSYDQLVEYAAFERSVDSLRAGENLLYGGDFEDVGQVTQFGWHHFGHRLPNIESSVELSSDQPKHGRYSLELRTAATSENEFEPTINEAPVSIVSPAMPVDGGQLIEIRGWVRIDEPLGGEGDGLVIIDSLGGAELALAIRQTSGWQPFRLIRGVPDSSELRITFALAGIGTAHIDAVMVRELKQPTSRRLPSATSTDAQNDDMAKRNAPMLIAPETAE